MREKFSLLESYLYKEKEGVCSHAFERFFTIFIREIYYFVLDNDSVIEQATTDKSSSVIELKVIIGVRIYNVEVDCKRAFNTFSQTCISSYKDKKMFDKECDEIVGRCVNELKELLYE